MENKNEKHRKYFGQREYNMEHGNLAFAAFHSIAFFVPLKMLLQKKIKRKLKKKKTISVFKADCRFKSLLLRLVATLIYL